MNKHEAVIFLFTIAKEIERSFESPVILFTQKDYGESIFKSLVDIRTALVENSRPKRVAEIVNTFHMEWLQAVKEIENFKKRLREIPRDTIYRAIDYTIECAQNRYKYFRKYIEKLESTMTDEENTLMQANLDIINDMHQIVHSALLEKQQHLRSQADQTEFYDKVNDEIEELMNWIDKLNDQLAVQFSKVLDLPIPLHPNDLTKTLKQIIEDVAEDPDPDAQKLAKEIQSKGKMLSSLIRVSHCNELEIAKVVEKIKVLEERISRLNDQESSALMALKHKSVYLEERLQSLENIKLSLSRLKAMSGMYVHQDCWYEDQVHIFNHILPHNERCRLVEQLVKLWNNSIGHEHNKESIISILSVADLKEVFSDHIGHFTVDKYGRKIYTKEGDNQLYQLNENNELISLQDDDKHVYFFDECGRYYLDKNRKRVYKASGRASEYVLNIQGALLKVKEEKEGTTFYYDSLGRYYINDYGRRIYRSEESVNEYERDTFGNLIQIRNAPEYKLCPNEPMMIPEALYLRHTLGAALSKCIADVVLHQPADPIAYLASSLEKYRQNISARQILRIKEDDIIRERQRKIKEQATKEANTRAQSLKGETSMDSLYPPEFGLDFDTSTNEEVEF